MFNLKLLATAAALTMSVSAASAASLSFSSLGVGLAFNDATNYGPTCENSDPATCYNPAASSPAKALKLDLHTYDSLSPPPGLLLSGPARVTVTFLGKEANAINKAFSIGGGIISTDTAIAGVTSYSFDVLAGGVNPLNFTFSSSKGTSISNDGTVVNCALCLDGPAMGFSDIFNGNTVYGFFDDSGARDDRDFDDMVVKITVAAVPLPAGLLLLGTALGGFGFARRRKSA